MTEIRNSNNCEPLCSSYLVVKPNLPLITMNTENEPVYDNHLPFGFPTSVPTRIEFTQHQGTAP